MVVVLYVSDGVVIFYDENAVMEIIIHFRTQPRCLPSVCAICFEHVGNVGQSCANQQTVLGMNAFFLRGKYIKG